MEEIKIGDKVLVEGTVKDVDEGWCFVDNNYWTNKVHPFPTEKKTYEDGLREAWDLARRIASGKEDGGFSLNELEEIFKASTRADVFRKFTPQKAAECIALWEARQNEIHVGDVVKDSTLKNGYAVVSSVGGGSMCCVIWGDGSCGEHDKDNFVKTGRTIDIAGLLGQIGGGENV